MGCLWSRLCESQSLQSAPSHNGSLLPPARSVPASQMGDSHVEFRSRATLPLKLLSRRKNTSIKISQSPVSPGSNGLALETLQHASSECDPTLLNLFKRFDGDVHRFIYRAHPEDTSMRRQACASIYAHFIGFLSDEKQPAREYKAVAITLTKILHLPKTEPFKANLEILTICQYGEQVKKKALASGCYYAFDSAFKGQQQHLVVMEDGRPVTDDIHRPESADT